MINDRDGLGGLDSDEVAIERFHELRLQHYAIAEKLAMTIAKSRAMRVHHLVVKAELLRELLRPREMGVDQPERWILLSLPEDIARVCAAH